ncbi:sigma-70 family RNA polymerase sigma factor [Fructilactobacillus vespulae]|uniref:sigma-70 family RNA polymerase sigma factor n=1 Tax=Fructilactobacillus vespulae TaxID=1249630 RepID=UPI0039B53492
MTNKTSKRLDNEQIAAAQIDEESFWELFQQFSPVYLKMWREFYLNDMELSDWSQEAAIVFQRSLQKYDANKNVTFGSFYKASLRNFLYDLLRKKNAQKRVPGKLQTSLSEYVEFYADTIQDISVANPYETYEFYETVKVVSNQCSELENYVLASSLKQVPLQKIADERKLSLGKVSSALFRCRRKYEKYTKLTAVKLDDKLITR